MNRDEVFHLKAMGDKSDSAAMLLYGDYLGDRGLKQASKWWRQRATEVVTDFLTLIARRLYTSLRVPRELLDDTADAFSYAMTARTQFQSEVLSHAVLFGDGRPGPQGIIDGSNSPVTQARRRRRRRRN